jgi:2-desacetyl-2-hydroxyethyl bacteriochlorophyllide A dehydrogenase
MSRLGSKIKKAVTQPHKIPGYVRRKAEQMLHEVAGRRIVWPAAGRAVLERFTAGRPGADEVTVLTHYSLVSPGTERAMFARLQNTSVAYPFWPGYSAAGEVVAVGANVTGLKVGDRVAAPYPHASFWNVPAAQVIELPEAVSPREACFLQLGVIALQGVRKAQIQLGERVAVLGPGPIGLLAQQMAAACGAYPVTVIASSARRLPLARELGAHAVLDLSTDRSALESVQADVTLEVTGNPDAFNDAIRCTRDGGRIVLLGSSRGITRAADFAAVQRRGIALIGAHIMSLPKAERWPGFRPERAEGQAFFGLLADGRLRVRGMVTDEINPAEAELFYRRLAAGEREMLAAVFRWERLPARERLSAPRREALGRGQLMQAARGVPEITNGSLPAAVTPAPSITRLRIGMIGCGEIAMDNARAVADSGNAVLTAVMDVAESVAEDMGQRYSVPFTTSAEALLARDDVDAVLISVPHFLHAPLSVQAARARKHVLVEKPMANTRAEAEAMLAAARENGVQLSVMYAARYLPYVQLSKRILERGQLGKLLGLNLMHYLDKPISYWAGGRTGRVASDWRLTREKSGGGILVFNLVHYLDLLRYLTGLDVAEAYSTYGTFDSPSQTEDTISITLRYTNGLVGNVAGASCVRGASLLSQQLRLWGTEGQLIIGEPFQFYSLHQVDDYNPGEWHTISQWEFGAERREFVRAFANAVLRGEAAPASGGEALAIQALTDAIYASHERHAPVTLLPSPIGSEAGGEGR